MLTKKPLGMIFGGDAGTLKFGLFQDIIKGSISTVGDSFSCFKLEETASAPSSEHIFGV